MLSIVILNTEKLNSQVLVKTHKLSGDLWAFTLNNITGNVYKIFLESCLSRNTNAPVFREASSEFYLHPGIATVTEKEIGLIISGSEHKIFIDGLINKSLPFSDNYRLSVCVRQKYGPDLGFQYIEL